MLTRSSSLPPLYWCVGRTCSGGVVAMCARYPLPPSTSSILHLFAASGVACGGKGGGDIVFPPPSRLAARRFHTRILVSFMSTCRVESPSSLTSASRPGGLRQCRRSTATLLTAAATAMALSDGGGGRERRRHPAPSQCLLALFHLYTMSRGKRYCRGLMPATQMSGFSLSGSRLPLTAVVACRSPLAAMPLCCVAAVVSEWRWPSLSVHHSSSSSWRWQMHLRCSS